ALLAAAGWRVVLVLARAGEQGLGSALVGPEVPLSVRRVGETARAADALGARRVEFLGYHASGLGAPTPVGAFADAPLDEAAARLAAILAEERAAALVGYDARGIYGHVDHVQVHRVGAAAAEAAGVPTVYESTVDREYLHFVETHLVVEATVAAQPERTVPGLGLAAAPLGLGDGDVGLPGGPPRRPGPGRPPPVGGHRARPTPPPPVPRRRRWRRPPPAPRDPRERRPCGRPTHRPGRCLWPAAARRAGPAAPA